MIKIFSFITKASVFAKAHKIISVILVVVVLGSGYWITGSISGETTETRYVTEEVSRGTLISSVSGSGQVSVSDQIDVRPKVSGDVVWVGVKSGQTVGVGQTLISLDSTEAQRAVADAELNLEEALLQLDKDIAQAPIDYERELESLQKAKDNLEKTQEDMFNTLSDTFLDLPTVITGLQNVLFGEDIGNYTTQWNVSVYRNFFKNDDKALVNNLADIAEVDYRSARVAYDENFLNFKDITRYSDTSLVEELLEETFDTTKMIAQAAKSETNLLDTIVDIAEQKGVNLNAQISIFQSELRSYLGTVNSNLSTLLTQQRSLGDGEESILNMERDLSLLEINNPTGINPISLQLAQNNIKKQEVELADLKTKLADYIVRAPFYGVIAEIDIKNGETLSTNDIVATLITKQKIAEIALNEIDVVKVEVGQKATITFDAVEGLSITGDVIEVDSLATVSQGVVTYDVAIAFDTQDDRIKPGMSMSVSIIIEAKANVLIVPNSAIQYQGTNIFVQVMNSGDIPTNKQVDVGSSNDTHTEILNGLEEGDLIVTQTVNSNSASSQPTSGGGTSLIPGGGFGGGRFPR